MAFKALLLATVMATVLTNTTYAVPFIGSMTLAANLITQPNTVTVDQATGINFVTATGADNGVAPGTVLNYGGSNIAAGTGGIINDIASFANYTTGVLFTLSNGLSFTLNAPLTVQRQAATASSLATLAVGGIGTFSGGGYDATSGIFTFTTQGINGTFNLASGSGVASVTIAEPTSLALVGMSLAGFAAVKRRRTT